MVLCLCVCEGSVWGNECWEGAMVGTEWVGRHGVGEERGGRMGMVRSVGSLECVVCGLCGWMVGRVVGVLCSGDGLWEESGVGVV